MSPRYIRLHEETGKVGEDCPPSAMERGVFPGIFTKPLNQNFGFMFQLTVFQSFSAPLFICDLFYSPNP